MKKTLLSIVAVTLFFAGSVALTSCGGGEESHSEEAHAEQLDEVAPAAEEATADTDAHAEEADHKCGEGKCGDSADSTAEGDHKCGEGKCGDSAAAETTEEGEHKCGEGKCGEGK
jgi:uncharacterized low-complexity protein